MRYIKYAFLLVIGVCLLTIALANRGMVTLRLLPEEIAELAGLSTSAELPLFLVILSSIVVGLLIGFVWEWLREHRYRRDGARAKREARQMGQEVARLKGGDPEKGDDVLALLETGSKAR